MSRLEDLIKELCPNGVEFKPLGEVLDYEQPQKYIVESQDYESQGTPVLTAGQTFILGYTNETDGVFQASKENPVIIFDDFTTSFHWVDFNFKIKSSAMKMLRPSVEDVSFKFIYYAMECIKYETLEHSRQWISKYSLIQIPLPPLKVQQEIARILDKFATLEAELEAELEARREQYRFYRERLLDGNDQTRDVCYKKLGDVAEMQRGTPITQKDVSDGLYPVMAGGRKPAYHCDKYNRNGETIVVAGSGANAGFISYWRGPVFVSDAFSIKGKEGCLTRYLLHVLLKMQLRIHAKKQGAGVPHVHIKDLASFHICVPPLAEQRRIVRILDKFYALTDDIGLALPAEIKMRHQQYEYYRDKLLTFTQAT